MNRPALQHPIPRIAAILTVTASAWALPAAARPAPQAPQTALSR